MSTVSVTSLTQKGYERITRDNVCLLKAGDELIYHSVNSRPANNSKFIFKGIKDLPYYTQPLINLEITDTVVRYWPWCAERGEANISANKLWFKPLDPKVKEAYQNLFE